MPFIDGKHVTNEEWMAVKGGPVGWKEATGWKDGEPASSSPSVASELAEVVPTASGEATPPKTRRPREKKEQAEAAIEAATGVVVDLDEADASLTDLSGIADFDAEIEGEPDGK